ncbi:hypothetical protein Leryth_010064 [Lithospermum erythrorhizon]|nr:hypothetical protein Leryth_010064 [Lithospermum erythrorhizon]
MGQRNMQYNSNMTDLETDQRCPEYLHHQPCVFYGSIPNFPQSSQHPVIPAPSNMLHHPPEHHDNALFFGIPQHNGFHYQQPASNVDRPPVPSPTQYFPYMAPPSASRDLPVPVNHGARDQFPFSNMPRVIGIPTESYGRSFPYMDDGQGSSKRKNFEGIPGVYSCHDASAASSSSVAPMGVWPVEPDVTMMDMTNFAPPDYRGNETSATIDNESHRGNRSVFVGAESSMMAHNANYSVQGSYAAQHYQLPGNPWVGVQPLSNISGDNETLAWNHQPPLPIQRNISGGRVDSGIAGVQGYQVTNGSRSSAGFVPPFFQRHPTIHHPLPPMHGVRGPSISFPSQVTSSRSGSINTFHGVVEAGPRYLGPVPQTGFGLYRPQQREDTYDMNTRHRSLPHLRVLPEDGVAMLEVPYYHEIGDSADQHRDMRLDIDQMSYEELLALGEQIGCVTTGMSEEDVKKKLKTRSFLSSETVSDSNKASSAKEFDFCVVCQADYKNRELVGTLDCGHEYHVDCIKKWLVMKNTCPVCKSTALNPQRNDL